MAGTRRVMVVDDNPLFTESMAALLQASGFEVARCHSGSECLERVANFDPHVIVSDYDMGGLDGLALLKRLREEPDFSHIPFVAVTAYSSGSLRDQFRSAGAFACHSKLDASDVLLKTLEKLLDGPGGSAPQERISA